MTIDTLLDFIAQPESRGDIDAIWGGISKSDHPEKPVSQMTIGAVLDWQDSIDSRYMSEASGGWQFMEDTLRGLYREARLTRDDLFDERNQRKLATALLRRRGLDDYLRGDISAQKFGQNLSKEWASLPCFTVDRSGRPAQGQSYYAGDGLNKSHVTREALLAAIYSAQSEPASKDPRKSKAQSTTLQASVAAGVSITGSAATVIGKLDPVAQYMVLGFAGIGLLSVLWIAKERIRKWAAGDR